MGATTTTFSGQKPNALSTISRSGFLCGCMDITAALVVYGLMGIKPMRLLQGVASGLVGARAFEGGWATAMLGLLCHFVVAFSAATGFFAVSRLVPTLLKHAVVYGILYGIFVYFFMDRIVVPLSAARQRSFSLKMMFIGIIIHIFCVGLPISLTVRRYSVR